MPADHAADKYGRSELLLAVKARDLEKVKELVAAGADVNETYKPKKDEDDDFDSLEMDVNAWERWGFSYSSMYSGMTALSVASYYGPFSMVKFLVESGASLHPMAYKRRTCLVWAIEGDHFEAVKYLLSREELDINVDLGLNEPLGCNPLQIALWNHVYGENPQDIVKLLLDHGAIVTDSAYEFALKSKRTDVITLLLTKYTPPPPKPSLLGCTCF